MLESHRMLSELEEELEGRLEEELAKRQVASSEKLVEKSFF